VVELAATVTEAGSVSDVLFDESATADPPAGAACESVTVQVDVPPEATVVGVHCNAVTLAGGGVTVMEVVVEPPLSEAVTVTA